MSGGAADDSLVTTDALTTWHILPRAVETSGTLYYGAIEADGSVIVVEVS